MSLKHFWEYVIEHGWQIPFLPEDESGNYECPFCNSTILRKVEMDEVPVYEKSVICPKCGEITASEEEIRGI